MPLRAETSGCISAQPCHGDRRGAAAAGSLPGRRACPAAVAALPYPRCHCHVMGQHKMAPLLPNAPEAQTEAHGLCWWDTNPVGAGCQPATSREAVPCWPWGCPRPVQARWLCSPCTPGQSLGQQGARRGTTAPSPTAAQPLHGLCVLAAAPSASAPLRLCQPQRAQAPGQLSAGIRHFGWVRTSPQAPHQLVAGRGRARLELGCPDGFACKELLGQGERGGAVLLTPVCGASGRQRLPARESRVRPQAAEATAAETRSLLCNRCRGDGGALGRGGGLLWLHPPGEGPGGELSAPLLQVSEQAKPLLIFPLNPGSCSTHRVCLFGVYPSIHMEKICSFEPFFISCNTTEQSRAGFVN